MKLLVVFSVELVKTLQLLAEERLTAKQKKILEYVSVMSDSVTVTSLVHTLTDVLRCSQSAVWNNLRPLKKAGILSYGDANRKGIPVKMTQIGRVICIHLVEGKT
ncbi:hypothetical protein HYT52_01605 [Candidatus Woesearchaeota archaeon]|nr:hypothetical protein [Candidatus Woesearchaeota archaeon]